MADESNKVDLDAIPVPPPPPRLPLPPVVAFQETKNLMKSPASLIGRENGNVSNKSALDLCKNFVSLRCESTLDHLKGLSWFYHNNDVAAYLQDGPTCGLIALKLAADILRTCGYVPAAVNKPDYTVEAEITELLQLSIECGFTYHGEMFSARDMASLAKKYYNINYKVLQSGLEDHVSLVNHIIQGYPVVVPYDSDKNAEPCLKKGHKAHWAVITGFLLGIKDQQKQDNDLCEEIPLLKAKKSLLPSNFESRNLFIIARHGKSRHYGLWPWTDIYNSNNNLLEFDQVELEDIRTSGGKRCLFTEGVQEGLCSKALFYYP